MKYNFKDIMKISLEKFISIVDSKFIEAGFDFDEFCFLRDI